MPIFGQRLYKRREIGNKHEAVHKSRWSGLCMVKKNLKYIYIVVYIFSEISLDKEQI